MRVVDDRSLLPFRGIPAGTGRAQNEERAELSTILHSHLQFIAKKARLIGFSRPRYMAVSIIRVQARASSARHTRRSQTA